MARDPRINVRIEAEDNASREIRQAARSTDELERAESDLERQFRETNAAADRLERSTAELRREQAAAAATATKTATAQKALGAQSTRTARQVGFLGRTLSSVGESLRSTFLVTPIVAGIASIGAAVGVVTARAAAAAPAFDKLKIAFRDAFDAAVQGARAGADFDKAVDDLADSVAEATPKIEALAKATTEFFASIPEGVEATGDLARGAGEVTNAGSLLETVWDGVTEKFERFFGAIGNAGVIFKRELIDPLREVGREARETEQATEDLAAATQELGFSAARLGQALLEEKRILSGLSDTLKDYGIQLDATVKTEADRIREQDKLRQALQDLDEAERRGLITREQWVEANRALTRGTRELSGSVGELEGETNEAVAALRAYEEAQNAGASATGRLNQALEQQIIIQREAAREAERQAQSLQGSALTGTQFQRERTTGINVSGGTFTTVRRNEVAPDGRIVFTIRELA